MNGSDFGSSKPMPMKTGKGKKPPGYKKAPGKGGKKGGGKKGAC